LRRHPISGHWLTIARTHRNPVCWIGIVPRIVSGWARSLRYGITRRHVAWHLLRHTSRWSKCNLRLAGEIRPTLDLDNSFETVFDRGAAPSRPAWGNTYTEGKSLSRASTKIIRPSHLDVSREQDVLSALSLLNSLIVRKSYPDHLFVIFKHSSLYFDPYRLNVFLCLHVDLTDDAFSFNKRRLVKANPDFAFRRFQMIE